MHLYIAVRGNGQESVLARAGRMSGGGDTNTRRGERRAEVSRCERDDWRIANGRGPSCLGRRHDHAHSPPSWRGRGSSHHVGHRLCVGDTRRFRARLEDRYQEAARDELMRAMLAVLEVAARQQAPDKCEETLEVLSVLAGVGRHETRRAMRVKERLGEFLREHRQLFRTKPPADKREMTRVLLLIIELFGGAKAVRAHFPQCRNTTTYRDNLGASRALLMGGRREKRASARSARRLCPIFTSCDARRTGAEDVAVAQSRRRVASLYDLLRSAGARDVGDHAPLSAKGLFEFGSREGNALV